MDGLRGTHRTDHNSQTGAVNPTTTRQVHMFTLLRTHLNLLLPLPLLFPSPIPSPSPSLSLSDSNISFICLNSHLPKHDFKYLKTRLFWMESMWNWISCGPQECSGSRQQPRRILCLYWTAIPPPFAPLFLSQSCEKAIDALKEWIWTAFFLCSAPEIFDTFRKTTTCRFRVIIGWCLENGENSFLLLIRYL